MGSNMMRIKRLTYMVMLIQIGQVVPLTGREPQVDASIWDLAWSLGSVGINNVWHWVQPKNSMFTFARLVVRQCGCNNYFLTFFISNWMWLVSSATIKVAWSFRKCWCSMTSWSTSISSSTISGIWCREEHWSPLGNSPTLCCWSFFQIYQLGVAWT